MASPPFSSAAGWVSATPYTTCTDAETSTAKTPLSSDQRDGRMESLGISDGVICLLTAGRERVSGVSTLPMQRLLSGNEQALY